MGEQHADQHGPLPREQLDVVNDASGATVKIGGAVAAAAVLCLALFGGARTQGTATINEPTAQTTGSSISPIRTSK